MKEFIDNDQGYLDWVENHPNGYTLNSYRKISPRYLPLHKANCTTITKRKKTARSDSFTSKGYKKLCFTSELDAVTWMNENHRYTRICGKCKPELNQRYDVTDRRQEAEHIVIDEDDESSFPEGKELFRQHRHFERDGKISKKAKAKRLAEVGKLECDACGLDFHFLYGDLGKGFIEAHHTIPVSLLGGKEKTKISDLALVCSNCHRMLHRKKLLSVADLKKLLILNKELLKNASE